MAVKRPTGKRTNTVRFGSGSLGAASDKQAAQKAINNAKTKNAPQKSAWQYKYGMATSTDGGKMVAQKTGSDWAKQRNYSDFKSGSGKYAPKNKKSTPTMSRKSK